MAIVETNGVQLHYQRAGQGPAVIFVHGGFASLALQLKLPATGDWRLATGEWAWSWEWEFARHFDFVWYDRRGGYHSTRPATNDYSLGAQAADLEGLLNQLGIGSAHLIGSSAGGPISIVFAAMLPARVKSLILTGTACNVFPYEDQVTKLIREQIALLAAEGPNTAYARRPEGIHTSVDILWEIEEARERGILNAYLESQKTLEQQASSYPPHERAQWYATELWNIKAYMTSDVCTDAQRVHVPTLILHGEKDQVVPLAWAHALMDYIPSAQFHMIEGGSHGLLFRNEEARRTAISFIGSCSE